MRRQWEDLSLQRSGRQRSRSAQTTEVSALFKRAVCAVRLTVRCVSVEVSATDRGAERGRGGVCSARAYHATPWSPHASSPYKQCNHWCQAVGFVRGAEMRPAQ